MILLILHVRFAIKIDEVTELFGCCEPVVLVVVGVALISHAPGHHIGRGGLGAAVPRVPVSVSLRLHLGGGLQQ